MSCLLVTVHCCCEPALVPYSHPSLSPRDREGVFLGHAVTAVPSVRIESVLVRSHHPLVDTNDLNSNHPGDYQLHRNCSPISIRGYFNLIYSQSVCSSHSSNSQCASEPTAGAASNMIPMNPSDLLFRSGDHSGSDGASPHRTRPFAGETPGRATRCWCDNKDVDCCGSGWCVCMRTGKGCTSDCNCSRAGCMRRY